MLRCTVKVFGRKKLATCVPISYQRNIRTRVDSKLSLKPRSPISDNEKPVMSHSLNEGRQKKMKKSKFDSPHTDTNLSKLQYKTPEQISKELKEQFIRDGIDIDDDFINSMIDQSKKEQELAYNYLRDPQRTLSKVNEEEINGYIDWIIQDGFDRIQFQEEEILKRKMELREKLNDFTTKKTINDGDPESMTNAFIMAQEMAKLNSKSALDVLPEFLRQISKINNAEFHPKIPLAKYAKLYELSTLLIDDKYRNLCIYLCGKLLYDALARDYGPRARPDPINEKFFIESCLQFEDFDKATQLFESRRDKDVKDERFWLELGVSIYLARYYHFTNDSINLEYSPNDENEDLNKSIELIQEISNRWGYVNNIQLIDGLKKCCGRSNFSDALWFWEELEINMSDVGIVPHINPPNTKMYDESEREKVFKYYNRVEKVTYDGISECIFAFIGRLEFETSMEMICKTITFDQNFIVAFVEKLREQFSFTGRELFLIDLERDASRDGNNSNYNPDVRDYLIQEISKFQPRRCSSFDEAKILQDTQVYLERLAKLKVRKNQFKVNDLLEILKSGEMLTSLNIKSLLSVLLETKSNTSFQIAAKILNQMNIHKVENITKSILPVANSDTYTEFCNQLLSKSNPRINEIKQVLTMMEQFEIPLSAKLATKVIMAFNYKKLFTEAISFTNQYVFSDNPIAIKKIELKSTINHNSNKIKEGNLYTAVLLTYYKSVVSGVLSNELFAERLEGLRSFIKQMIVANNIDDFTFQEAIGTLLAYGDYQSTICFVQWYGEQNSNKELSLQLVLALKSRLEVSLLQAEKYLVKKNTSQTNIKQIKDYRLKFGIQSMHEDLKTQRNYPWQEVAMVIYKYADLFGFKSTYSKEDPFAIILSDQARNANQISFDKELSRLQTFYGLSEWRI